MLKDGQYRDNKGHFITRKAYYRNMERRIMAKQQHRADGKFAKKKNYLWVLFVAAWIVIVVMVFRAA